MNNYIEIGKRIKSRREELNYTQQYIGSFLGVDKSTIQRYETGKVRDIKLPMLQAIARVLDVDPNWLSLKTDQKNKAPSEKTVSDETKSLEETLLGSFRKLNDSGQAAAVAMVNGLTTQEIYKKTENNRASKLA